jgi:serine O-acetyltransferase
LRLAPAKVRAALATFVEGVRVDHATMCRVQAKYNGRSADKGSLSRDVVEKVGFQVMAAYRVMRFFAEIDASLASRVMSRAIRHVYGSDIHWSATLAPGVTVVHGMGMAISGAARIDEGVLLFQHCTLGEGRHPDTREVGAPTVEKEAVIGAGATILGPITIGARSKVMPGCVVVRSVPPDSIVESPKAIVHGRHSGEARQAGQ